MSEKIRVAEAWLRALKDDDFPRAWKLTHPKLRRALVQDWLDWSGPNLLAVAVYGRDAVVRSLASPSPAAAYGREFDAFTDRLVSHWAPLLAPLELWEVTETERLSDGCQAIVMVDLRSEARLESLLCKSDEGWAVAALGSRRLPVPGAPADLAGTVGAGLEPAIMPRA